MTDSQWSMQRKLAISIFNAYMEWNDAENPKKHKAEKKLLRVLALRSTYQEAPRA